MSLLRHYEFAVVFSFCWRKGCDSQGHFGNCYWLQLVWWTMKYIFKEQCRLFWSQKYAEEKLHDSENKQRRTSWWEYFESQKHRTPGFGEETCCCLKVERASCKEFNVNLWVWICNKLHLIWQRSCGPQFWETKDGLNLEGIIMTNNVSNNM